MNIGICGICGRMGQEILKVLLQRGHTLSAAFDSAKAEFFGRTVGELVNSSELTTVISEINRDDLSKCDAVIDFSAPGATMSLLPLARELKKPLVIGTTGFSDEEREIIKKASEEIPVLFSPNMSVGVNLFFKLTEIAASALSSDYDAEVFEAHHRMKKDAPSGTAARLVDIIKAHKKDLSEAVDVPGRSGIVGERKSNEIGVFAMRGGDIVGEHTVFFAGTGERLELTHRATNRNVFASGAVPAAEYVHGKKPGFYSMFDVLGF